jgi:tRNA pseudouridine-54 N-methylase
MDSRVNQVFIVSEHLSMPPSEPVPSMDGVHGSCSIDSKVLIASHHIRSIELER